MSEENKLARHVPFGNRLQSLDGLRGLAILAVICEHTLRLQSHPTVVSRVWAAVQESSWAGVDLFFVLSGFLITGVLLDSRNSDRYFLNFYVRRALRIFPLYYLVVGCIVLLVPALVGLPKLPELYPRLIQNQIWLWTYLQNYLQSTGRHTLPGLGHFWTLAVEEQFYWFWPFVVFRFTRRRLLLFCLGICLVSPILRFFLLAGGQQPWAIRQYTFARMDTLVYGALAALAVRNVIEARKLRRLVWAFLVLAAVSLIVLLARNGFVPYEGRDTEVFGYSALGLLFASLIFHIVTNPGLLSRALSLKTLRWFGKYSYCIYIVHWPVAQVFEAFAKSHLQAVNPYLALACFFTFTTVTSGLVAIVSWHVLEEPFLKLKRYFEYERNDKESMEPKRLKVLAEQSAEV